jgi:glutathione synthase
MDPPETVKVDKDTSYQLIRAFQKNNHRVWYINPMGLTLTQDRLSAIAYPFFPDKTPNAPLSYGAGLGMDIGSFSAVLIRTDPPVDRRYFYTMLLMDHCPVSTRVYNQPRALIHYNEKLLIHRFAEVMPPSLVSASTEALSAFVATHGKVVMKPLDGFGGRGIRFLEAHAQVTKDIEDLTRGQRHWIVAQAFIPEADAGDKRVILWNAEPLGAILRIHGHDSPLNNLDAGGTAVPCDLTDHERAVAQKVGQSLIKDGVFLIGLDFLGPFLTEVNITSPTGLQQMSRFQGENLALRIVRDIESQCLEGAETPRLKKS